MRKKATKSTKKRPARKADPSPYPKGWDRKRVQALIDHYDHQPDDDAVAEAEAAYADGATAMIQVPLKLLPKIQKLLSKRAG